MFEGTSRYQIRRKLGAGGMGVVYETDDLLTGLVVALKTLRGESTGERIARLKAEFRSLADVLHPNLVALYELERTGDAWFFTMELVRGVSMSRMLLGNVSAHATLSGDDFAPTEEMGATPSELKVGVGLDPASIGPIFAQIARGVAALHARSKLHRDLKPSNVLLEPGGRAVILDFGLVSEIRDTGTGTIMGTPAYMAPEQVRGDKLTEACDWYGFGTMLYQALLGELPFGKGGGAFELKLLRPAPSIVPRLPSMPELARLVDELLRQDPSERPVGRDILTRLQKWNGHTPVLSATPGPRRAGVGPIGRDGEVQALESAFRHAENGRLALTLVSGPSGIGKSEVLSFFVRRCAERGAMVLTGRCFDRENVPYKMLDPLIDDLVVRLQGGSTAERATIAGIDRVGQAALVRMFPAFGSLIPLVEAAVADEIELRQNGFRALITLFRGLRALEPLVLWVDDIQWGDADSLTFFGELLRTDDPPAMLCVVSGRSEDTLFHRWLDDWPQIGLRVHLSRALIGPLDPHAARELALAELPRGAGAGERADRIVADSGGSPLWVRILSSAPDRPDGHAPSLDELIWSRVLGLSREERLIILMASIAVRPLDQRLAQEIAGGADALHAATGRPRAELLLRIEWARGEPWLEPFHDRVRQIVLAHLTEAEQTRLHVVMADILERLAADPELIALHHQAAGAIEQAANYAVRAADAAAQALAFDRAATLYRIALSAPSEDRALLLAKLARALASSGRRFEAGQIFHEVSTLSGGEARRSFRRQALRSFLLAGYVTESMKAIRPELERIGLSIPSSAKSSLASAFILRARAAVVRVHERPDESIDPGQIEALDLAWDVRTALSTVDPVLAAKFSAFHTLLARRVGARSHLLKAMGGKAAMLGSTDQPRAVEKVRAQIRELGDRIPACEAHAQAAYGLAIADTYLGVWGDGYRGLLEARRLFDQRAGVPPENGWGAVMLVIVCHQLGRIREAKRWMGQVLVDSEARGDLWSKISVRTGVANVLRLTTGDDAEAEAAVTEAERLCAERQYTMIDGWNLYARCQIDLFRGRPVDAIERIERAWPHLERNFYLHVGVLRISTIEARGRAALAASRTGAGARYTALARDDAKRLEKEGTRWSFAVAALLRAGLEAEADVPDGLREAEAAFERADMLMHVHLIRRRRGQLLGGDTGRALVDAADRWATDEGLTAIEALSRVWVPL